MNPAPGTIFGHKNKLYRPPLWWHHETDGRSRLPQNIIKINVLFCIDALTLVFFMFPRYRMVDKDLI